MASKSVNDYISNSNKEAISIMKEVKQLIQSTVPEAEEGISWNVPIYKYHGVLAGFDIAKKHVSFGIDSLSKEDREKLKEKGYKTGSKTIQIQFDQKVPVSIIKKLLKSQAQANLKNKKVS